jgi:uncharacterized protein (DUF427 family)
MESSLRIATTRWSSRATHYFPPESVDHERLEQTRMKSLCPWKGVASYYTVLARDRVNVNAAWTYRHPYPWIRKIRDHVAFWHEVEIRR